MGGDYFTTESGYGKYFHLAKGKKEHSENHQPRMKKILFLNQRQESYKHYNKSVKETADHLGESISWASQRRSHLN